jgi:hypothetical protein
LIQENWTLVFPRSGVDVAGVVAAGVEEAAAGVEAAGVEAVPDAAHPYVAAADGLSAVLEEPQAARARPATARTAAMRTPRGPRRRETVMCTPLFLRADKRVAGAIDEFRDSALNLEARDFAVYPCALHGC